MKTLNKNHSSISKGFVPRFLQNFFHNIFFNGEIIENLYFFSPIKSYLQNKLSFIIYKKHAFSIIKESKKHSPDSNFLDPADQELGSLVVKEYIKATDEDTSNVSISIKTLSIDTSEAPYPANSNPSKQDANPKELAKWINTGDTLFSKDLAKYLYPMLVIDKAGSLQEEQRIQASNAFNSLIEEKLKFSKDKRRQIFLRLSIEPFDSYGILLAYPSPKYSTVEIKRLSSCHRTAFNLLINEKDRAESFSINPSLPKYIDVKMQRDSGKNIWGKKLGYKIIRIPLLDMNLECV